MGERRGTKGLELWCRRMTEGYPGVKIDNMTTSWRDGLAFCAIIHHFRPDLIEFSKLNKDDVYYNNDLAFRVAERHLGIPALLEPEDMVEYSVPDRLSILTYLSQFYQAFGVSPGSKSAARIAPKRPTSSPDHGIVSPASTSPPTKVAIQGSTKVRREPCAKCDLPVFIAERLNVGKLLYHRTCFRCARCNSQLTLANYYETESNQFCCETCPDEEKSHVDQEPQDKSVLSRSLSDEEKSASIKATQDSDQYSTNFETALEFPSDGSLKRNFTLTSDQSIAFAKARSHFISSQMEDSSSDSGNEEEEPPDLPKSQPPKLAKSELVPSENTFETTDSIVSGSTQYDSGFPSNRLEQTVNSSEVSLVSNQYDTANAALEETHNIVTKDKHATSPNRFSLVKARMQLFESNKSTDIDEVRKSDVHNKLQTVEYVPSETLDLNKSIDKGTNSSSSLENQEVSDKHSIEGDVSSQEFKTQIDDSATYLTAQYEDSQFKEEILVIDDYPVEVENSVVESVSEINEEKEMYTCKEDLETKSEVAESSVVEFEESTVESVDNNEDSIVKEPTVITLEDSLPIVISDTSIEESPANKEYGLDLTEHSENAPTIPSPHTPVKKETKEENYPENLNPFGEDDEPVSKPNVSLNPFGDADDDEETQEEHIVQKLKPVPSPRTKKKISPLASDWEINGTPECLSRIYIERISVNPFESDDEESAKPPLPANRTRKVIAAPKISLNPFWSGDEEEEENLKQEDTMKQPVPKPRSARTSTGVPEPKPRENVSIKMANRSLHGSSSSLSSSASGFGSHRKKKPAPQPPSILTSEIYDSPASSLTSSPCHSVQHSPRLTPKQRKSKKAPLPPRASTPLESLRVTPQQLSSTVLSPIYNEAEVKYRKSTSSSLEENDFEKEKIAKDEMNRNRQSQSFLQSPSSSETSSSLAPPNKSTYGKWKRRKGLAPSRPIPQRRIINSLPMGEVRRELEVIEIQQQGLEKQGVRLEQIIRDKCENNGNPDDPLAPEVEDLILQLFELVNEKNELFRKQAELMYLRRQQRLEEEHADVEYQIRCLMLQPEPNKTDSDKAKEEELIQRLVDIVERRNEIIECLEMDRVREAEEDDSISNQLNLYTLKREEDKTVTLKTKKKKHKKEKKLKSKDGNDIDKDIDETEISPSSTSKEKKKKKKFNIF